MSGAPQREKIIVAVHGIGEQVRYATIQAVGRQLCRYYGVEGAIPLGRLYSELKQAEGEQRRAFLFCSPPDPNLPGIGLAEVYWANVPQIPAQEGFTLEETKAWVKTIVERLRLRQGRRERGKKEESQGESKKKSTLLLDEGNFLTIKQVLLEMIDTVRILQSLVWWLQRITNFRFPLNDLLVKYLGDVQVVAEYSQFRKEILAEFNAVMSGIAQEGDEPPEIYLVAHSEGTVISFLALLKALEEGAEDAQWVRQVRGFMTIGSPIDKHIILWPELWKEFAGAHWRQIDPIPWFNYFDFGDPVGFKLDTARDWMTKIGNPPLAFPADNDIGFSRYVFPGVAHTGYWRDDAVFQHFIRNVGIFSGDHLEPKQPAPLESKRGVSTLSITVPYLLVVLLCTAGMWILYKGASATEKIDRSLLELVRNVGVLGGALGLATAAARLPRLAHAVRWWVVATVLLVLALFLVALGPTSRLLQALSMESDLPWYPLVVLHAGIVLVGWLSVVGKPKLGLVPVLAVGLGGVMLAVVWPLRDVSPPPSVSQQAATQASLWPELVALVGFLYFWWLAALLFDLSFVWHRYIRGERALDQMHEIAMGEKRGEKRGE